MEPVRQPTLTSTYYLSVVRRRRKIVIAAAIVGAVLGLLYVVTRPSGYSSSASVVIRTVTVDPFPVNPQQNPNGAATEQNVMASTVVAEGAAKIIGSNANADDILKRLTVTNPTGTQVLNATFHASTPEKARQGAQAFADAYLAYKKSQYEDTKNAATASADAELATLQRQYTTAQQQAASLAQSKPNSTEYFNAQQNVDRLQARILDAQDAKSQIDAVDTTPGSVIKPARQPTGTSGVPRAFTIVATTVLGLLVGVVIALIRQRTDPHMRNRQDFVEAFDRPPLGEIHMGRGRNAARRASMLTPEISEFRHLRARLWPTRPAKLHRVLVTDVASPSTTAHLVTGVATSLANAHWRVLVIWPDEPGTEFDPARLEDVDGLRMLPWSSVEGYSDDSIDPTALVKVLDEASEIDDVVLLAGAPIQSAAEGPELYSVVDGVLLSFDPTAVRTDTLQAAIEEVGTMGGDVAGVVVSPVPGQW